MDKDRDREAVAAIRTQLLSPPSHSCRGEKGCLWALTRPSITTDFDLGPQKYRALGWPESGRSLVMFP
jgi:hypothetical protein